MAINVDEDLTYRQVVLLKLLSSDEIVFKKRTFVPKLLSQKEWKYCNSLVDGNCMWFGGHTTRKDSKTRGKVHQKNLGLGRQLKLIVHNNPTHTEYKMNKDAIKQYLLTTLSRKFNMRKLSKVISELEEEFSVDLRNYIGGD
jgi:hypothetical protein